MSLSDLTSLSDDLKANEKRNSIKVKTRLNKWIVDEIHPWPWVQSLAQTEKILVNRQSKDIMRIKQLGANPVKIWDTLWESKSLTIVYSTRSLIYLYPPYT